VPLVLDTALGAIDVLLGPDPEPELRNVFASSNVENFLNTGLENPSVADLHSSQVLNIPTL
jgi:hypothetical protein